jgi:hypothetical protein
VDDSSFPRTPDRLLMLSGSRAQQSEVVKTMTGACGPYNLGGSTTPYFLLYSLRKKGYNESDRLTI